MNLFIQLLGISVVICGALTNPWHQGGFQWAGQVTNGGTRTVTNGGATTWYGPTTTFYGGSQGGHGQFGNLFHGGHNGHPRPTPVLQGNNGYWGKPETTTFKTVGYTTYTIVGGETVGAQMVGTPATPPGKPDKTTVIGGKTYTFVN